MKCPVSAEARPRAFEGPNLPSPVVNALAPYLAPNRVSSVATMHFETSQSVHMRCKHTNHAPLCWSNAAHEALLLFFLAFLFSFLHSLRFLASFFIFNEVKKLLTKFKILTNLEHAHELQEMFKKFKKCS